MKHLLRDVFLAVRRHASHLCSRMQSLPTAPSLRRSHFGRDWAQAYPTRPVRLIVGFAAGGDIVARLIGQWLSERLGQPFVIENRQGAGTNIATEAVVRASPHAAPANYKFREFVSVVLNLPASGTSAS